jgi:hypothetical protein
MCTQFFFLIASQEPMSTGATGSDNIGGKKFYLVFALNLLPFCG